MTSILRWTGLDKLSSFYRYFAFNGPRTTTMAGITLLLGIAAIRLYWLDGGFLLRTYPAYLARYFELLTGAALLASAGMVAGRMPRLVKIGWGLGSLVSATSIAAYVLSRTVGLPGLSQLVGWWDYALGTFSMVLAALFLGLHFSVLTGMNIAYPQRRRWHD
jgi:hypothetical protein